MRKTILGTVLGLYLCLLTGCLIQPVRIVTATSNLQGRTDISLLDVNDPNSLHFVQNKDGSGTVIFTAPGEIQVARTCRIKYHWLYYPFRYYAVVEGRLEKTKRTYPVLLDTGASMATVVNDRHILENKLTIHPCGVDNSYSAGMGVCRLSEMRIGQIRFINLPCTYIDKHLELQLFGLPVVKDNTIILGLPVLQAFKYVLFDNIKKQAEFSPEEPFEPEQPRLWKTYPFFIKEKSKTNNAVFVEIPIEAERMTLLLDTGCSELILPEKTWQRMCCNYTDVKLKTGDYLLYAREKLSCRKGVIKKFRLGSMTVRNVPVVVLADDVMKSAVGNCDGLLGISCFRDTVLVLDFHRGIIWVRSNGID